MKNINFEQIIQKIKQVIKHFMFYVIFILSLTVGFSVGYYYNTLREYKKNIYAPEVVLKKNVTSAIDEQNNMITRFPVKISDNPPLPVDVKKTDTLPKVGTKMKIIFNTGGKISTYQIQ